MAGRRPSQPGKRKSRLGHRPSSIFVNVSLRTKCHEKQIFAQGHCILKTWKGFCSTHNAFLFLDGRVHPEGLGIVMDKKLPNNSC